MTASLICVPPTLQPSQSWLGHRSRKSSSRRDASQKNRAADRALVPVERQPFPKMQESDRINPDVLFDVLLNAIQEGVIVVSRSLQLVYRNQQASELCQQLHGSDENINLPPVIVEACHHFLQTESEVAPLVVECQENSEQFMRLQIRWLSLGSVGDGSAQSYLLILMEDCCAALTQELLLEKQKYDLTDREAEIWMMIRQEYTYQKIAEILQISVNTVKTHAKNAYAKRNSLMGQRKIWYSR